MNKLKGSRVLSFVAVISVYVAAAVVGIFTFRCFDSSVFLALLIADVLATVFVFLFSLIFKNASVYDPYWSVQPIVILSCFLFGREISVLGILLVLTVFLWGIRLTANWAYTFKGLNFQDWRYTMLSEKTGKFYPIINFVGIHMVPTLIVYAVTVPALYVIMYGGTLNPYSVISLSVSLLAVTLQCVSDMQMHRYRKDRNTPFIRNGLWKYSRHPNYLGEIMMWWGIGFAAFFAFTDKPLLLIGAFLNTLLFLFVSIPMADKRQSRKEGFDEYKKHTRMLLPIGRK